MNAKSGQCDAVRITRFLEGELSEQEQRLFQEHLDACATCSERLEQSTADVDTWREASELLCEDPFDLEPVSGSGADAEDAAASRHVIDDGVRRVVELLHPTDDPQMLGRIGGYEVSGVIGSGGNGVVLKGYDRALDRFVAIKLLAPHLAGSGAARGRFAREAQAAAAVMHENVISIHGVDEHDGLPFLVMSYVRGTSLQRRIHDDGPLPLVGILRIGMQTAAGLAAAHAQGLVHRDIKPANILLADGVQRVTITDFGLARAVDDASMTRSGMIAGTPQFMSPEQARGDAVDHRSDLFSLGSVLYTMCTGHPPFRAETSYGMLRRICQSQPRPIRESNPEIPAWLCRLIQRLHQKDAQDRFQTAAEVADLLSQCIAHVQQPEMHSLPAELYEAPAPASSGPRSTRLAVPIGAISIAALLVSLYWNDDIGDDSATKRDPTHVGQDLSWQGPGTHEPTLADPTEDDTQWNDQVDQHLLELDQSIEQLEQGAMWLLEP